jgi:urease accessory protein
MAAVWMGAWSFLLPNHLRALGGRVPACFLAMMAAGAVAGFSGIKLPLVEAAILASDFVIGGVIVAGPRLPAAFAMAVVGVFTVFHGSDLATEASQSALADYILGMRAATALLQAVGLGLGWLMMRIEGELGLRAPRGIVRAGGALFLIPTQTYPGPWPGFGTIFALASPTGRFRRISRRAG